MRAPIGVSDATVELPGHIALFFSSAAELWVRQERFLRYAIEQPRESIVLFGPQGRPEEQLHQLELALGRDLRSERDSGRIALVEGRRDADAQLAAFTGAIDEQIADGAELVRVMAMTAWDEDGWPYPEDLLWFETRITATLASHPTLVLCAYDVGRLPGPALVLGGLHAHPHIVCGKYAVNEVFEPPDHFVTSRLLQLPWLADPRAEPPTPGAR